MNALVDVEDSGVNVVDVVDSVVNVGDAFYDVDTCVDTVQSF